VVEHFQFNLCASQPAGLVYSASYGGGSTIQNLKYLWALYLLFTNGENQSHPQNVYIEQGEKGKNILFRQLKHLIPKLGRIHNFF
jgi:hypothetical protein